VVVSYLVITVIAPSAIYFVSKAARNFVDLIGCF